MHPFSSIHIAQLLSQNADPSAAASTSPDSRRRASHSSPLASLSLILTSAFCLMAPPSWLLACGSSLVATVSSVLRSSLCLLPSAFILLTSAFSLHAEAARRIVSGDAGIDTLVLQLADLDQVLAVQDRTQDPSVSLQWERARQVRGLRRDVAEDIYRLQPDLILFGQWSGKATRELLQRVGCNVIRLKSPASLPEVYTTIQDIGDLIGQPARADAMVIAMQERVREIAERLDGIPRKRAVFYFGNGSTYGARSRQHDMLEHAGLTNIAAGLGIKGMGKLSLEGLLLEQPDMIIFTDYKKDIPTLSRQILNHPAFKQLQTDALRIVELPSNKLNSIDISLVDCVEQLARAAYPEAFQEHSIPNHPVVCPTALSARRNPRAIDSRLDVQSGAIQPENPNRASHASF